DHRLYADRGVLVNRDTVHGERGQRQQREVDTADIHLPPERSLQRQFQTVSILIGGDVRRDESSGADDAYHADRDLDGTLHCSAPMSARYASGSSISARTPGSPTSRNSVCGTCARTTSRAAAY